MQIDDLTYFRGRVALHAILKALGIGRGDQVAVQAYTCVAVPEAVIAAGASPVYIDVGANGFTMDPMDLERRLTPGTKAIVFQHTFGIPSAVDEIARIAALRGIPLIEDCCHTYLSEVNGRKVGSFGIAGFFSFEWGKPIVAGMGGSAVVSDPGLRDELVRGYAALRNPPWIRNLRIELEYLGYGILFRPRLYWIARRLKSVLSGLAIVESSYNTNYGEGGSPDFALRMAPSSRRRLTDRLANIESAAAHSESIANEYRAQIRSAFVKHPCFEPAVKVVYARYPLITTHKDEIMRLASRAGVEVAGWYATPVHPLPVGKSDAAGYSERSCPNAEQRANEVLTLPTHTKVTPSDVERTVAFFNSLKL